MSVQDSFRKGLNKLPIPLEIKKFIWKRRLGLMIGIIVVFALFSGGIRTAVIGGIVAAIVLELLRKNKTIDEVL